MSTALAAQGISKKYVIGHQRREQYTTLRDVLSSTVRSIFRNAVDRSGSARDYPVSEDFWALSDVSFDIKQGDRVGIIGRNGAGKSTLLKVLSRITEPTSGKITIRGRVSSLLEVGTGFHPELTGRENIFLNGAILGMSKVDIRKKFDAIVDFSEVEKFLDTPVKRYSSGMYVRLAFAVAAHLEPDILIVDEVLAVGDAQFQKKCLGKMQDVGQEGRTVLFVSHNMVALKSICDKAIWLGDGKVVESGNAEEVVSKYLQIGSPLSMYQVWNDPETAPGNDIVRVHSASVTYGGQESGENLTVINPVNLEFKFWNLLQGALLNFSIVLYDNQEVCIFNTGSEAESYPLGLVSGVCCIPGNLLNDGTYRVQLNIVRDKSAVIFRNENIASFEVHDVAREGGWFGKWRGAVRPKLAWETTVSNAP